MQLVLNNTATQVVAASVTITGVDAKPQYIVAAPGDIKTLTVNVTPSVTANVPPPSVSAWMGSVWLPLQNTTKGPQTFAFDPYANKKLVGQIKDSEQEGVIFYIYLTTEGDVHTLYTSTQQPPQQKKKQPLFNTKTIQTFIRFGEAAGVVIGALVLMVVVTVVARAIGRKHRKKLEQKMLHNTANVKVGDKKVQQRK